MGGGRLLLAIGLVRSARPAGFCPACRVLMKALDARQELAKPMVAAVVVLALVAAVIDLNGHVGNLPAQDRVPAVMYSSIEYCGLERLHSRAH